MTATQAPTPGPLDWTPWSGGPRPHPPATRVCVRYRDGTEDEGASAFCDWLHSPRRTDPKDVVAYKVVREAPTAPVENPDEPCAPENAIDWPTAPVEASGSEEIGDEYEAAAHCVTLAECPPGLFFWNGTLGFKSDYGAMEPVGSNFKTWKMGSRADAYCADSGEYFWGGTSNHDDRAKVLVMPIDAATVAMVASHGPAALRPQPSGETRALLECIAAVRARKDFTPQQANASLLTVLDDCAAALSTTPARAEAQDEGAAEEAWIIDAGASAWATMDREEAARFSQKEEFKVRPLVTAHPSPTPAADADRVRIAVEALEPFVPVWAKLTGLSDGIDVRLDASFALQDATGRARGATCNPNLPKLTVGDFRKAHEARAALKSTAAKEGGE